LIVVASLALRQRERDEREAERQLEISRQRELAEAAKKLAHGRGRLAMVAVFGGIVAILLAVFGGTMAIKASQEAKHAIEQADIAKREAERATKQTVRAQASLARIENEHGRYYEAAVAALAGLTNPLTLDTDPDQLAPWAELLRATAMDAYLVPPLKHDGLVWTAAFDDKGERVVTASWDKTARIWDARTGQQIGPPLQHESQVNAAAFDATGERVVTASGDARIWDARTGQQIGPPLQHEDTVWAAAFDAAGERVVTASGDKTARTGTPAPGNRSVRR
jgi:hypothetical protein